MNSPDPPVPRRAGRRGWVRRHRTKLATSLLIAAGFVWLLHAGALPLLPGSEAFDRVRWWTVPAYMLLWTGVHVLRAVRWHWLLLPIRRVALRIMLPVAFIGFAAIVLLPFRAGEAVRPVLIHRRGGLSGWAATGTVAAERIVDGLVLSCILFIGLGLATPLDPSQARIGELPVSPAVIRVAAYGALALFAVAFVMMGVFYWRRQWARRVTESAVSLLSPALARWLSEHVERIAEGLGFLPQPRLLVPFVLTTVAYWMLNVASAWLLAWGCGFDGMTLAQASVTVGVIALGILTPNAPGFFGAFQISCYAGFAMFYPTADVVTSGAAFVFIVYLAQMTITLAFALGSAGWAQTSLAEGLSYDTAELSEDRCSSAPAER